MVSFSILEKAENLQSKFENYLKTIKSNWKQNPTLEFGPFYISKVDALSRLVREMVVLWFIINYLNAIEPTLWGFFEWFNYFTIIHLLFLGFSLSDLEFITKTD